MKFLQVLESMQGMGVTTTASVAVPPGAGVGRKPRPVKNRRKIPTFNESALVKFDVRTALLFEVEQPLLEFNNDEVSQVRDSTHAKVDNALKQSQIKDQRGQYTTSTFGLQDADGNIVRVTVNREEAADFEQQLNSLLADTENQKEIAEILYILRNDFEILDVDWADSITEDEDEEAVDASPSEDSGLDDESDLDLDSDEDEDGEEIDIDSDGASDMDMQQNTVELLQQVIELLRTETESRSAEAELRTAKAQSQTQQVQADQHQREIDQQVEMANVEKFEEEEKEKNKHEKLIQRIARYRATQGQ